MFHNLHEKDVKFWKKEGACFLEIVECHYKYEGESIIDERTKIIHNVLGEKRYELMSDIIERMEQGDEELIKQIANIYKAEGTQEGNKKAQILQDICRK